MIANRDKVTKNTKIVVRDDRRSYDRLGDEAEAAKGATETRHRDRTENRR